MIVKVKKKIDFQKIKNQTNPDKDEQGRTLGEGSGLERGSGLIMGLARRQNHQGDNECNCRRHGLSKYDADSGLQSLLFVSHK